MEIKQVELDSVGQDASVRLSREVKEVGVVEEVVEILDRHHDGLLEREHGHRDRSLAYNTYVASAECIFFFAAFR